MICLLPAFLMLLIVSAPTHASEITVGHGAGYDYPTITAAITSATDGDTIEVAHGVYDTTTGEVFPITVKDGLTLSGDSEGNLPEIRGDGKSVVILLGPGKGIVLEDLKITGGGSMDSIGGGVRCDRGSRSLIQRCLIVGNRSWNGGGLSCYGPGSNLEVANSTIRNNTSDLAGSGVSCSAGSMTIADSTVTANHCERGHGAVSIGSATLTLVRSVVSFNTSNTRGNGIELSYSTGFICESRIMGNRALGTEGSHYAGLDVQDSSNATVKNTIICGNHTKGTSGGVFADSQTNLGLYNCTIAFNTAEDISSSGGIYLLDHSRNGNITVRNCIIWGNSAPQVLVYYTQILDLTYSDVQGGFTGSGNINEPPLFLADWDENTMDLRLACDSPCLDSGSAFEAPAYDLLGIPRPQGQRFDMGAFEGCFSPKSQYDHWSLYQ